MSRSSTPHHPPWVTEWLLRRLFPDRGTQTRAGDFAEAFQEIASERSRFTAGMWYRLQFTLLLGAFILGKSYWSGVMLKNYLKIAFRHFRQHKGYTLINMFGLTTGIACCLVIFLFVSYETSYDSFRPDGDRIYRVAAGSPAGGSATVSGPVARVLGDYFPEVETVARILPVAPGLVSRGEVSFFEKIRMYADDDLFQILGIPFVEGNPEGSLDRPDTVVISERVARKYYGGDAALGKILSINGRDWEVTGVAADAPPNSHFKYDCILPLIQLKERYPFERWFLANLYVYIKVNPNIDHLDFAGRVRRIALDYAVKQGQEVDETDVYFLQPVPGIHLDSHLRSEMEPGLNPLYLYVFSAVAFLVLLIACFNFINLSTARSLKRAREVGVRKVIGARRGQLIRQFFGESSVIILAALILALILVWELLPFVNSVTGRTFSIGTLLQPRVLVFLLLTGVFVGFAASGYPSVSLSAFQPTRVLKHDMRIGGTRGSRLRKVLVVCQFAASIMLIAGTLIVNRQIDYMKGTNLGFDMHRKLVIPVQGILSIEENYETVRTAFLSNKDVVGASIASDVLGQQMNRWYTELVGEGEERAEVLDYLYVDPAFLEEFNLKVLAGRPFQRDMSTDIDQAFILNRSAVRQFGWTSPEEALGKRLKCWFEGRVIGVVEDFHYLGLQSAIEPLTLVWRPEMFDHIILTLETSDLPAALAALDGTWKEFFPGAPSEHFFMDSVFNRQYLSEERVAHMLSAFALLAVFIACLGLLGLASFTAEHRTKEIGIRKVLGATRPEILALLSKEFAKWILLANVIAWPLTYLAAGYWLNNFAYRTSVSLLLFVLSSGAAFAIALLTISYFSLKAASADPVASLKYE